MGRSVLMMAIEKASTAVVRLLLENKADITAVSKVTFNILSTCLQPDAKCRMDLFCCVTVAFTFLLQVVSHLHAILLAEWNYCVADGRG
jgi:ankyrin repeat protein